MNLKPEDRTIGKENFCAAIGSKQIRRDFLEKQVRAGVASKSGLGPYYYGYGKSVNSAVRVGVIGTGDEGSVLIGALNPDFFEVRSIADIRPYNQWRAFNGDYRSATARQVRPGLERVFGDAAKNIKVYGPYQELIDNAQQDQIEAVIIALPLHLHCSAAIAAMKAGLHVLTEKLMAHSVRECKEMARLADSAGLHLAVGHQRHYNILYDNAVEMIGKGLLGELHYIRAQWHRGNLPGSDSWQQPLPRDVKPDDVLSGKLAGELSEWRKNLVDAEEGLAAAEKGLQKAQAEKNEKDVERCRKDIDKWQKDIDKYHPLVDQVKNQIKDEEIVELAKQCGYSDKQLVGPGGTYFRPAIEELIRWRLWDRTGGGLMAELGSHQLDAASIFIAAAHKGVKQHPLSVVAAANRPIFPLDREVEDHVYCVFDFPAPGYDPNDPIARQKKIGVQYSSINGNGFGGYGETVLGTQGTLILERETDPLLFRTSAVDKKVKVAGSAGKLTLEDADDGDEESAALGRKAIAPAERGYAEELEHWAWCIREDPKNEDPDVKPKCHPKLALGDAVIALTTNMAARHGLRVEFKEEWFDPDNDTTPEADVLGEEGKPDLGRYGA